MNNDTLEGIKKIIGEKYAQNGWTIRNAVSKKIKNLLENKRIPEIAWNDTDIKLLLNELSVMDCNNSSTFTGMGEREGRVFSSLVRERHFGLSHGIGRSGDITAIQPKAVGSSVINKLVNSLLLHLTHEMGFKQAKSTVLFPMATGMTITLCFLLLRRKFPLAKYVIWSRIDQKSCFKSILAAGFEPLVVELKQVGDELQTDLPAIARIIEEKGASSVLCIFSTTSCFAPRVPDDIVGISRLCAETGVAHVINNAYGAMIPRYMHLIQDATAKYKSLAHLIIQSTDKNLMVPVGGAFVASPDKSLVQQLATLYPGRASASPAIDVLITLLSMGLSSIHQLTNQRQHLYELLIGRLKSDICDKLTNHRLTMLSTPRNHISLAIDISHIKCAAINDKSITSLGAHLFHLNISGARIIESARSNSSVKSIEGHQFTGFGSHSSVSQRDYLNVAVAIGQTHMEIDRFINQLHTLLTGHFSQSVSEQDATSQPDASLATGDV